MVALISFCGAARTQVMRAPGYYLPPAAKSPAMRSGRTSSRGTSLHGAASHGSNLLDLNTATVEQLNSLPGMGAVYSRRVIAGRPYHAKNQLVRRGILPAAEYVRISGLIVAHRMTTAPANSNTRQR